MQPQRDSCRFIVLPDLMAGEGEAADAGVCPRPNILPCETIRWMPCVLLVCFLTPHSKCTLRQVCRRPALGLLARLAVAEPAETVVEALQFCCSRPAKPGGGSPALAPSLPGLLLGTNSTSMGNVGL